MATAVLPSVSVSNLEKIESFMNDVTYKEALESSANYNTRLCIERRLRLPFLDSQTGMAQNHSSLFMNKRQRMPGLVPGQIYTYPRQRWRKKRRQYLAMNSRAFGRAVEHMLDEGDMHSISQVENPLALQDTDSKDSQLLLKDEVTKEWFYDEQDMLEMDAYDEPDPDSDLDYEESYSKRSKKRRGAGRGRGLDSPGTPGRKKGGGRGRKKASAHNFDPTPGDPDKPFACERSSGRRSRQPPPPIPPQIPPTLPPNLPPTVLPPSQQQPSLPPVSALDDPPMPVLIPEKQIEPPLHQLHPQHPPPPPVVVMPPPVPMLQHPPQPHHLHPQQQQLDVGLQQRPKVAPSPYCDFCLGNSNENKKTGVSEELVSCSDCGRSGHPTCLLFTANMKISVKKYRWQCIECKCCSVCGTSDNDDQLLFCDDCDRGYHMYCLAPPLTTPPEGSWSCKLCIDEFHK